MDYAGKRTQGIITRSYRMINAAYGGIPRRLSRSGRAFPPWHYFFEVTRRCNLRCIMCQYIDWLRNVPVSEQGAGELTTDEWLRVIDQTVPYGLITFTGGEVWLRKDFPTILEYACSKRRVHFISNAVLLNDERAELCAKLAPKRLGGKGLNFVGVSIDGTREAHNLIRAQNTAFERATSAVRSLAQHSRAQGKKCPLIHMNTVVTAQNLAVLADLPQLAAGLGIRVLNLLTESRSWDNPGVGSADPATFDGCPIRVPDLDRHSLDEALRAAMDNGRRLGVEIRLPRFPYEMFLDHHDGGYDLSHLSCPAIWNNLIVNSKGDVSAGCMMTVSGNVRDGALKGFWNNAASKTFRRRRRLGAFSLCRGCCENEYEAKALKGREEASQPSPEAFASPQASTGEGLSGKKDPGALEVRPERPAS